MNRQMVGAVAKPPGPPVRTAASGEGCLYSGQNGLCWLPLSPCSDEADRMSNGLCVVFYRQDLGILPVPTIYSVSQITCLAQSCQSQRLFPCTFLGSVLHKHISLSSFFCIFLLFQAAEKRCSPVLFSHGGPGILSVFPKGQVISLLKTLQWLPVLFGLK